MSYVGPPQCAVCIRHKATRTLGASCCSEASTVPAELASSFASIRDSLKLSYTTTSAGGCLAAPPSHTSPTGYSEARLEIKMQSAKVCRHQLLLDNVSRVKLRSTLRCGAIHLPNQCLILAASFSCRSMSVRCLLGDGCQGEKESPERMTNRTPRMTPRRIRVTLEVCQKKIQQIARRKVSILGSIVVVRELPFYDSLRTHLHKKNPCGKLKTMAMVSRLFISLLGPRKYKSCEDRQPVALR